MDDSFIFCPEEENHGSLFGGAELSGKQRVSVSADVVCGRSTGRYRSTGMTSQSLEASPGCGRGAEEGGTVRSTVRDHRRSQSFALSNSGRNSQGKRRSQPTTESKKSSGRSEGPWEGKRDKTERVELAERRRLSGVEERGRGEVCHQLPNPSCGCTGGQELTAAAVVLQRSVPPNGWRAHAGWPSTQGQLVGRCCRSTAGPQEGASPRTRGCRPWAAEG